MSVGGVSEPGRASTQITDQSNIATLYSLETTHIDWSRPSLNQGICHRPLFERAKRGSVARGSQKGVGARARSLRQNGSYICGNDAHMETGYIDSRSSRTRFPDRKMTKVNASGKRHNNRQCMGNKGRISPMILIHCVYRIGFGSLRVSAAKRGGSGV